VKSAGRLAGGSSPNTDPQLAAGANKTVMKITQLLISRTAIAGLLVS
jgi:hypothetical protein